MQPEHVPDAVPAERDPPGAVGSGQQKRHAGQHPFERAFHRPHGDLHRRVFPQQNVMLEIDSRVAQFDLERGHQFALDVIGHAAEGFVLRRGR